VSWRLISDDVALTEALATLPPGQPIAVDTEFMRRNTFYPQIALLQLCAGGEALLIDPLALSDVDPLRELLTDSSRDKVLHSCSEDLEVFSRWLGVLPEPLIDTQRAAALVGEPHGLGYRALVSMLLGIDLDKGETRSDWLRRPLSESQCHYAAQDVLHLLPAWEILRARAQTSERLDWVAEEGAEALRTFRAREQSPFRRVKGAGRLSRRELACLNELCDWREEKARASDKPRGWVIDDKACLAIARAQPAAKDDLAALDVLPPAVLRRQGDTLLDCVRRASSLADSDLPPAQSAPLPAAQRERLKTLKAAARERAENLGVAAELLLPGADLELLLREAAGESIEPPARWAGWRAEAVIAPLRELAA
jgi:ribonuclease D